MTADRSWRYTWKWTNVPLPERYLSALGLAALLQVAMPLQLPLPGPARLVGGPMVAAGAGLIGWAVASAGEASVDRPAALITAGAFAVTRNPMYLGWGTAVLGLALMTRNAWLLIAWLHASRAVHREVLDEERLLAARFGPAFEHYLAERPRYLPRPVSRILAGWPRIA